MIFFESMSGSSEVLLALSLILVSGMVLGKIAEMLKIPAITGYIVAGVILGSSVTGVINDDLIASFKIISNVALGFIAFTIGEELWLPKLKKSGKTIIIITLAQALTTVIVVLITLLVFQQELWLALILAAIATATAPAPIMMIVKKYRAKGPVTDTLIPVVGIDDAIGIVVFGVCLSVGKSLAGSGDLTVESALLEPLKELVLSIVVGSAIGLVFGVIMRLINKYDYKDRSEGFLVASIIAVLFSVAIADYWHLSSILTPMLVGLIFTNMVNKDTYKTSSKSLDAFTPPIMVIFFTLAGAELKLEVLLSAGAIGILYVIGRSIGKMSGAFLGSCMVGADPMIKKYLGPALLPQGGVEIGLVMVAVSALPAEEGLLIQTVVLAAILVYEIVGPVLTKIVLTKAGEIEAGSSPRLLVHDIMDEIKAKEKQTKE